MNIPKFEKLDTKNSRHNFSQTSNFSLIFLPKPNILVPGLIIQAPAGTRNIYNHNQKNILSYCKYVVFLAMIVCRLTFCFNYIDYGDCEDVEHVDGELLTWPVVEYLGRVGDFVGDFLVSLVREFGISLRILKFILFILVELS